MDKDRRTGIAAEAELRSGADAPRAASGDSRSSAALFQSLYTEPHRLAQSQLRRGSGVSLSATTRLHVAYLDLSARDADRYPDRAHFMAYAAHAMRGIVIDYARNRHALKRGGAFHSTTIDTRIADEVAAEVADASLIRSIVDATPDAPSEAATLARGASPEALADAAGRRGTTPERVNRRLRGDLDNIVARALKKEPRERYASVDAFAEDLRRHRANEPVSARPDSLAYRTGKFIRRNRVPVALASVALAAVLAGLAETIVQARRAIEQRDFALKQAARVEAVNDLTSFLLYDASLSGKPFTSDLDRASLRRMATTLAQSSFPTGRSIPRG